MERVELRDGTALFIRPIRPDDKARLQDGLGRLSPRTVHRRFLGPKPRFSEPELRYLTEVDGVDHFAVVAVPAEDPTRLVAVARYVRDRDDPRGAEAAIVVADLLQGLGAGRALALRIADEAARNGIRSIHATFLGDNVPAQRLMRTIAARLTRNLAGGGIVELTAELPRAA